MTMTRTLAAIAFVALLLAACGGSSGFQQATARESVASYHPVTNDQGVRHAFALRPQLPQPYRLGVFFRDAQSVDGEPSWRWEPQHKKAILDLAKHLEASGQVADMFVVGQGVLAGDELGDIRVAAARHGADAVLVVSGVDEVDHHPNGWAWTYAAVLPLLFAPGNQLDVLFTTHAEMWDVRNEFLYLAAEAEAEAHQMRAAPYIDSEDAIAQSQTEAVTLLATELQTRFNKLHSVVD